MGHVMLIADRKTSKILGCHIVGERAVDIVQVAAIAIAAGMRVDDLAWRILQHRKIFYAADAFTKRRRKALLSRVTFK